MGVRRRARRLKTDDSVRWLLEGDAAICWQAHRDLLGASKSVVERERARVALEGWGGQLLALQARDGTWGGGLYTPKWTSTTYTMLLLRDLGIPTPLPQLSRACTVLLDGGLQPDGGINFKPVGWGETCITGMTLSIFSHCRHDDRRVDTVADHLLAQQMGDGGWNCKRRAGATHSSVNTTINALEALARYEELKPARKRAVREAQRRGREFLLVHRLFRSHRTGRVIKPEFLRLAYPPRWHYTVLRALDHFQAAKAARDPRLAEAVEIVRRRQRPNGRWNLEYSYGGPTHFRLERDAAPSRWITLQGLRILKWWDQG